jgi:uncharacterized protein (DUF1810 family)
VEHDLERFVSAQADMHEAVLRELRSGAKTGHWMWFVFPQIAGLGTSEMNRFYAIGSLAEAQAYLAHPVLGRRLRECAGIVAATRGKTASDIFGATDERKLHSSMTLFHLAAPDEAVFRDVLDRFFEGRLDPATTGRLPR